jgi:oligopeptide/dipeptide ABC transporter ATP-binding protein
MLDVANLSVGFRTESGPREVLSGISLAIAPGEILGLVGESGSGKSVTALAIMRLLGEQGRATSGRITLDGTDLLSVSPDAMRAIRGRDIGMIFQEPMTSLNPLLRIGFQIAETLHAHTSLARQAARTKVIELLTAVGIPEPAARADAYPHQLSGGMRQRAMIAMAMACAPRLLIADEPTTALDVTIQAQILALMRRLRDERGTAILLITHDMGVIARMADRVAVMYAGEIVESAPSRDLLTHPAHPYTRLLLAAMPSTRRRVARLPVIAGQMPPPGSIAQGCRFRARCPIAIPRCSEEAPALAPHRTGTVRCWRAGEPALDQVA